MDTHIALIAKCNDWFAAYDRDDDDIAELAYDVILEVRDAISRQASLMDAVLLALPDDPANELRRISSPGTTSSLEGADCRNVVRNLANIIDGTWRSVPGSAAEGFAWAVGAEEA